MRTIESKAQRRHSDQVSTKRQYRIAKSHGIPVKEEGYLRKYRATNCGTPKCRICGNPRRTAKGDEKLTIQEKRAMLAHCAFNTSYREDNEPGE